jgi:dihydroorotase
MTRELLRQVRLIDPLSQTDQIADVLIVDGVIEAISSEISDLSEMIHLPTATEVRDCTGLILAPGLVDLYSHSGEPGFEDRETLASLRQAAIAGGFTRLTLLPDTEPALDHVASVEWVRSRGLAGLEAAEVNCQLNCWGALTLGVKGEQMVELVELSANVLGFADGQSLQSWALLRRILEYGQELDRPIALWCCDQALTGNGVVREGGESFRLGLPGVPVMAEAAPLAALLECVAEIRTPVHIMRVSTARAVELIQTAKSQGLPITASTTWMHLLLDVTAVQSYHPSLHLQPPLGNPTDREALVQGLQTGSLDAIAIDHSPYTYEEKTVAFAESPAGAIGLELALPLLWQHFVAPEKWTAAELWRYLSTQPAQCLNQRPARVAAGETELILFNPEQPWQVNAHTLKSLSTNTPWLEQEIRGQVVQTWLNGGEETGR